ncbi:DEAD-like helicase [Agrobacterium pusense]|uniref:DEAD-like helicase n=1 Tax=Agrobacterium pusense TaxID=648995 RepID=U4Q4Y8_9HYPH|nr:DEAD-like helicase [Agrobacterium pusense]CDI08780.1 DEAD-like helicase [Agrobacterium pusense]
MNMNVALSAQANAYAAFLARKAILDPPTGLTEIPDLPSVLFPFQRDIVTWALKRGRAALFAGTGLGKSFMELAWGQAVSASTQGDVLHFAPLAVAAQMVREAEKFGIPARHVRSQSDIGSGINVTNYQKIDAFDLSQFSGVILDESSILKSETGHYRNELVEACHGIPFRLAATATPAPNDFMELGNHAEFLGIMSYSDMLATFFTHDGGETQKWRLKGHAENDFWRWMASWAVMLRKPSDLGYDDGAYLLPALHQIHHTVTAPVAVGDLVGSRASTLQERIKARRDSVDDRVAFAAAMTPKDRPFVWWCNLNAESEALTKAIPGAVEVRGSDKEDVKERKLIDFSEGRIRVLVTKPSIAGFGMNWQHCADTGFVGLNDSFEQIHQAVRRFYRFGQQKEVTAHFIAAETEGAVVANLKRKEADADRMAAAMVLHTANITKQAINAQAREKASYDPKIPMQIPSWLGGAA